MVRVREKEREGCCIEGYVVGSKKKVEGRVWTVNAWMKSHAHTWYRHDTIPPQSNNATCKFIILYG